MGAVTRPPRAVVELRAAAAAAAAAAPIAVPGACLLGVSVGRGFVRACPLSVCERVRCLVSRVRRHVFRVFLFASCELRLWRDAPLLGWGGSLANGLGRVFSERTDSSRSKKRAFSQRPAP